MPSRVSGVGRWAVRLILMPVLFKQKVSGLPELHSRLRYADSRPRYAEVVSAYRLRERDIITFLRHTFGEGKGQFHVERSDEQFRILLPRPLSDEEKAELYSGRLAGHELLPSDQDSNLDKETRDRELLIPLIRSRNQSVFKIPSEENSKDLSLIYSISKVDVSRQGVASSLYVTHISQGFSSDVFEVDARWSWARQDASQSDEPRGLKVAVKRLSQHTKPGQFLQEYDALKAATRAHHRNIVELLNAFRLEDEEKMVHYNFSFPLAIGNLKELFHHRVAPKSDWNPNDAHHRLSDDLCLIATKSLWSEFEGLGSALAHLHERCQIVHSDIKPSNVLLYGPYGSPPTINAKLTDFGLAVDLKTRLTWQLGSRESQSAWHYDAPELRIAFQTGRDSYSRTEATRMVHKMSAEQLMGGDVWKLGSLFIEMLTFLIEGLHSTLQFRKFITTTVGDLTSDDLDDSRFDDGEKVKAEVLQWLTHLASKDPRAYEMYYLLRSMLDTSSKRPSSGQVAQAFKSFSICTYFDGARDLNFISSNLLLRPSFVDRCKQTIEERVGHPVDWRPFKQGHRTCSPGNSRILWYSSNKKLYIDVPDAQAQAYRDRCHAVSDLAEATIHPHQSNSRDSVSHMYPERQASSPFVVNINPSTNEYELPPLPSRSQSPERPGALVAGGPPQRSYKEIYWCVDRAWTEPRSTKLCSLREHPEIRDDKSLCELLIKEYNRVRAWKGRIFSWKSCLGIEFIKFARISTRRDNIIRVQIGLPPFSSTSYEISRLTPEEVHMKIAASELIAGIHQPHEVKGRTTTLDMIPKRIRNERANGTSSDDWSSSEEWGMHALPRFSLWKILVWIVSLAILGLVFVIFWLVFIDKTDLQNAFIPFTFLATMIMIGLGVPQLLEVD